jgi:hypothetical protein
MLGYSRWQLFKGLATAVGIVSVVSLVLIYFIPAPPSAQNPRRRCLSRRSVLSQPGGSATTAHRRNNVVGQMLHEYATTLSTAAI